MRTLTSGNATSTVTLFRAQEPKAPVTYCDHALSGVRPSSVVFRPLDYLHFRLLLQNRLMDFDETWYGWSTQGPLQVLLFFGLIRSGRIQGGAKIGHGGPLLQETSSSDQKATATNRMHSSDLETCGKKCCYFWFHSEVKFLTRFWRLFGLSQICLIKCNFYRFLCGKELYLHLFCVISMFISGRMHIVKI